MMAELVEGDPVYILLPGIKKSQLSRRCVIAFDCKKGKTENLVLPS